MKRLLNPVLAILTVACLHAASTAAAQETTLKIGGTGATLGTLRLLAATFEKANPGVSINVLSSLGSTGGIKAVIAGAIDIGVSGRPLSDSERKQGANAVEYARAPLVFAVSQTMRIAGITTTQLIDIYAGKMTKWPDGTTVRPILRPSMDINTITVKTMLPKVTEALSVAEKRQGMLFALTDQEALEKLDKVPGSIGPITLGEIRTGGYQLIALRLDGVEPSPASITDGSYPLFLRLYLVTGKSRDASAERFIAFVQSEQGRRILIDTGHSPTDQAQAR